MKIGIEAQRLFRPKKHGMDIVALELIKSLHDFDLDNEYHLFVKKDSDVNCIKITNKNFVLHVLPSLPYPIWEQFYLPFYVKKLKLDLLHCTANTAPLVSPCKLVVTLHDIIFLESNPLNKGTMYQKFGNLYRRWVVPFMVKYCRMLITVSYFEQKRIKEHFGYGDDKVKVVYNGVGNHFFEKHSASQLEEVKVKYKLPDTFILFLGNQNPKKNLPNVIRAYSKYITENPNGWDMVVLDYNPDSLKAFVEAEGLSPTVLQKTFFPGYVPNRELPLLIQASQLFLYPSLRESFGIPILEAMACGIPVITSNTSSMPEVANECAYLVDPLNVQEIAAAIRTLQVDEQLRQELKRKGLERSALFAWKVSAAKSLELYRDVANAQ